MSIVASRNQDVALMGGILAKLDIIYRTEMSILELHDRFSWFLNIPNTHELLSARGELRLGCPAPAYREAFVLEPS